MFVEKLGLFKCFGAQAAIVKTMRRTDYFSLLFRMCYAKARNLFEYSSSSQLRLDCHHQLGKLSQCVPLALNL